MDAAFLAADEKLEIGFFGDKVSAVIHEHFISHGGKGFADGEIERACILFIFGGKPFAKLCHLPQRGIGRAEDCESGQLRFFPFYGNGLLCGLDTIRKPNPGKLIGFDAVGINAVHACGKQRRRAQVNQLLFDTKDMTQIRAEGLAQSRLRLLCGGRVSAVVIENTDYTDGLAMSDFETAVDIARSVRGVKIAVVVKGAPKAGVYRVSLRGNDGTPVRCYGSVGRAHHW